MAFNSYNPVTGGLLRGFSLANLMQRAAQDRAHLDLAKQREERFGKQENIREQLLLGDLGAEEIPAQPSALLQMGDLGPALEAAASPGEVDEGGAAAPAASLGQILEYGGKRYRIPTADQRHEKELKRKVSEIKATEQARLDLRQQEEERRKVLVPDEISKVLGYPAGYKVPGEALDNVAQAYIQKLNRDKPKENKVVGHQLVTDDSGNVRIALTRENGEVETRAFGQIGKKTRPEIPRRVPGAETENQRNLRERQATEARDKIEQQLFDVQAEIDQIGQVLSTRKPTSEERAALEQKKRSLQNKHKLLSRQHAGRFGRTEGAAAPAPTGGKTSASSWEAYKKRFAK